MFDRPILQFFTGGFVAGLTAAWSYYGCVSSSIVGGGADDDAAAAAACEASAPGVLSAALQASDDDVCFRRFAVSPHSPASAALRASDVFAKYFHISAQFPHRRRCNNLSGFLVQMPSGSPRPSCSQWAAGVKLCACDRSLQPLAVFDLLGSVLIVWAALVLLPCAVKHQPRFVHADRLAVTGGGASSSSPLSVQQRDEEAQRQGHTLGAFDSSYS